MILRVDPRDGSARLLSIPRDSPDGAGARRPHGADQRRDRRSARDRATWSRRSSATSASRSTTTSRSTSSRSATWSRCSAASRCYFTTPVRDRNTGLADLRRGLQDARSRPGARVRPIPSLRVPGREGQVAHRRQRRPRAASPGSRTSSSGRCAGHRRRASATRPPLSGLVDAAASAVKLDDTLTVGTHPRPARGVPEPSTPMRSRASRCRPRRAPGGVVLPGRRLGRGRAAGRAVPGDRPGPADQARLGDRRRAGPTAQGEQLSAMTQALVDRGIRCRARRGPSGASATTSITYGPRGVTPRSCWPASSTPCPKLVEDDEITGYRVVLNVGQAPRRRSARTRCRSSSCHPSSEPAPSTTATPVQTSPDDRTPTTP